MADVTPNTRLMYQSGDCDRTVLLSCRNATANDTLDVNTWLLVVKKAGLVSDTGTTIAAFNPATNGSKATPSVLTIPAGPLQDGVWIIAQGVAAP